MPFAGSRWKTSASRVDGRDVAMDNGCQETRLSKKSLPVVPGTEAELAPADPVPPLPDMAGKKFGQANVASRLGQ